MDTAARSHPNIQVRRRMISMMMVLMLKMMLMRMMVMMRMIIHLY